MDTRTGRPTIDQRIASYIGDLDELGEDLPRFDELDVAMQDAWLYEFPDKMARMVDLEHLYSSDEMTVEQQGRYRILKAKFDALAPSIRTVLELSVPEELTS